MKIVLVNRYFYPDHAATSQLLADLAFHLASQGREVHVISSRQRYDEPGARLAPQEDVRGVAIHRVWTSIFGRGNLLGRALDYLTFHISTSLALLPGKTRRCCGLNDRSAAFVVGGVACGELKGARLQLAQDVFRKLPAWWEWAGPGVGGVVVGEIARPHAALGT
jgi:hypothetical protein